MPLKPLIPSPFFRFVALGLGILTLWLGYYTHFYRFGAIAPVALLLPLALFEFWRFRLGRPPEQ